MSKTAQQIAHEWVAAVTRAGITRAELDAVSVGSERGAAYGRGAFWYSGNVRAPIAAILPGAMTAPAYTDYVDGKTVSAPIPEGAPTRVPVFVDRGYLSRGGFGSRDNGGFALAALRGAVNFTPWRSGNITGTLISLPERADLRAVLAGHGQAQIAAMAAVLVDRARSAVDAMGKWRIVNAWRANHLREALREAFAASIEHGEWSRLARCGYKPARDFARAVSAAARADMRAEPRLMVAMGALPDAAADDDAAAAAVKACRAAIAAHDWARKTRPRLARDLKARAVALRRVPDAVTAAAELGAVADGLVAQDAALAALPTRQAMADAINAAIRQVSIPNVYQDAGILALAKREAKRAGADWRAIPHYAAAAAMERKHAAALGGIAGTERRARQVFSQATRGNADAFAGIGMRACSARMAAMARCRDVANMLAEACNPAEYRARYSDREWQNAYGKRDAAGTRVSAAKTLAPDWQGAIASAREWSAWSGQPAAVWPADAAPVLAAAEAQLAEARAELAAVEARDAAEAIAAAEALTAAVALATVSAEAGDWAAVPFEALKGIRTDTIHNPEARERARLACVALSAFEDEWSQPIAEWKARAAVEAWRAGAAVSVPYDVGTMLRFRDNGTIVQTSRHASVPAEAANALFRGWRALRGRGNYGALAGASVGAYTVTRVTDDSVWIGCHVIAWEEAARFAAAAGW
ncbi:MAG: hypothetical protein KAX84_01660 [Burkholderiales bacterium]|nr:hypothetical protein [Burkholderiales bacterium]